jgi:hypothetical protein
MQVSAFLKQLAEDETSASFYEIENIQETVDPGKICLTATVLHRGLISGYPGGSVCRHVNLTSHGLPADIAADFALFGLWSPR